MTLRTDADVRAWLRGEIGCDALGIERLNGLSAQLHEENERQNLVSKSSLEEIWLRHIADSAQLLLHVPRGTRASPWLDLGTGAGFPGLVVAICRPDVLVSLVESRAKRVDWLSRAITGLGLSNAQVLGQRVETVQDRTYSVISARAFAPLSQLIALAARFSTSETSWLLPKGRGANKELAEMPAAIQAMFHVERSLTDPESAILVGRGHPGLAGSKRR